jgi:hypothetical protein
MDYCVYYDRSDNICAWVDDGDYGVDWITLKIMIMSETETLQTFQRLWQKVF